MSFRRGQLEYFVAVAENGQMTSAARRLGIAQPALSQAISQLESELGLKLLDRHPRGVSLTRAGEVFYEKARIAVAASAAAASAARSLARGHEGAIDFGFLGAPPSLAGRVQMESFAAAYPDIVVRYRELPFPGRDTSAWLDEVDVAACHRPPSHPEVWSRPLRYERRIALLPAGHRLASRQELRVEDAIDETFIGFSAAVEPSWAGFWSLDDHRGGPPASITADRAGNPQEVLASLAAGIGITLVPEAAALILSSIIDGIVVAPIVNASRVEISLVGHVERRNPLVQCLLDFAEGWSAPQPLPDAVRQGGAAPS